ncbi:hypothetical protein ACROYT_G017856 [Oculina patagonica]
MFNNTTTQHARSTLLLLSYKNEDKSLMYSVTYNGCVPGMATTDDGSEPMDVDPHPGTTGVVEDAEMVNFVEKYATNPTRIMAILQILAEKAGQINLVGLGPQDEQLEVTACAPHEPVSH